MKTKLPLFVALAAAIGSPGALAQEQSPPQLPPPTEASPAQPSTPPPATPPEADRPTPPSPPERRDREERAQGRRGERARERDRDRGDDHEHDHDRARPDERRHRGPGGPDGMRPGRIGEPQPYLGVMTSPMPAALSAQLGLEEGFGLLIQEVLPNSPAATAGLQKHDVLKLLNDQKLVEPSQLATLIRAAGKDSQVALTIIRKGQEQKVSVTVGERVQPVRRRFEGPFGAAPMLNPHGGPEEIQRFHERVKRFQDRIKDEHQRRMSPQPRDRRDPARVPSADILKEARPGGGAQITVYSTDGVTKIDGAKARLILKDADGEIEVAAENGKRTLTAKNPKGEVVFSGPVNTKEERESVPEQFRSKLDKIEVRNMIASEAGSAEAFAGAFPDDESQPEDNIQ